MDKSAAQSLLKDIQKEYPELLRTKTNEINLRKEMFSFKIEVDLIERAKKLAVGKSVSNVMRQAVKLGLPELESKV